MVTPGRFHPAPLVGLSHSWKAWVATVRTGWSSPAIPDDLRTVRRDQLDHPQRGGQHHVIEVDAPPQHRVSASCGLEMRLEVAEATAA